MIFHITSSQDWEKAKVSGKYTAVSLYSEGFIHSSARDQLVQTANLFFKGQKGLVILCIDESRLNAELRYENAADAGAVHDVRPGELFPHIYGGLNTDAVMKVVDFPAGTSGLFELPEEL